VEKQDQMAAWVLPQSFDDGVDIGGRGIGAAADAAGATMDVMQLVHEILYRLQGAMKAKGDAHAQAQFLSCDR